MKTIKTILLGLVLILGVKANAQDKAFTFGVKAGANMSTMTGDINNTKLRFGFNAGVTVDYGFTDNWYILTGLEYTTKGVDLKKIGGVKPSVNASYIQLPIHAGYKLNVSPSTKIVFQAGPYVALGVNGKTKNIVTEENEKGEIKNKFNTFGDDNVLKRFDFGLGLGVGAEFGKINVGLGYDFGLLNVSKFDIKDYTVRNGNAYLTVGYKF